MSLIRWGVTFGILVGAAFVGWAEDSSDMTLTVKEAEGHHFRVPPDWPIEERGGIVAPVPVEEYLHQKFSRVDQRLGEMEQRLSALEVRVRVWEEEMKNQKQQRLRSTDKKEQSG